MNYINTFFIYSIIGFIFEIAINFIFHHKLDSGFLIGPYTPIYGIGIIIIGIINKYLDKKRLTKKKKFILTFIINTLFLATIEFIGGQLINLIFHKSLWNYSHLPLHIGKYISLEISIIWGIMSLIYIYLIKRLSDKIAKKIPKWLTYTTSVIFIIDLIYTTFF